MINDYPIYTYGLGDRINSRLHDVIIDNIKDPSVREVERIVGRRTGWTFHKTEVKEVQLMVHWINQLIPQICQHFIRNPQRKDDIQDPGFNPYWIKIAEMWGLHYKKNESFGELYHLKNDPWETINLYENPKYKDIKIELTETLVHQMMENIDKSPAPKWLA